MALKLQQGNSTVMPYPLCSKKRVNQEAFAIACSENQEEATSPYIE